MRNKKLSPVMADVWRHYGRASWPIVIKAFFHNRTFAPVATLRLMEAVSKRPRALRAPLMPFAKLTHRWAQQRAAIDLPAGIKVGPGFRITHGWGLVINRNTVLGSNVTLMHGVTLGGKKNNAYPTIGNNVFIGAHAIVLGRVSVGDGAIIGPGCVVTKDVPAGRTVVGNPQRDIGPAEPASRFLATEEMLLSIERQD